MHSARVRFRCIYLFSLFFIASVGRGCQPGQGTAQASVAGYPFFRSDEAEAKRRAERAIDEAEILIQLACGGSCQMAQRIANRLTVEPTFDVGDPAMGLVDGPGMGSRVPGSLSALLGQRIVTFTSRQSGALPSDPAAARSKFRVLLQGGLHGNEALGRLLVAHLALRFSRGEGELAELAGSVDFDFLPVANPDGERLGQRTNGRGVDLNRNFPVLWRALKGKNDPIGTAEYPGVSPLSEPESQAVAALLSAERYDVALDFHGYADMVVLPSTPAVIGRLRRSVTDGEGESYTAWKRMMTSATMAQLGGGMRRVIPSSTLGHGGAFEDYAFWGLGTMAACIEISEMDDYSWDIAKSTTIARYETFVATVVRAVISQKGAATESKPSHH